MKKLVVAGMLGLAAFVASQAGAHSMSLMLPKASVTTGETRQPLVLVQSVDEGRVQQLEETIRSLNGRIEEMSFQILQMQELLRKTQEDNEFRFQELEKKSGKKTGSLETPGATATDDVAAIIDPPAGNSGLPDAGAVTPPLDGDAAANADLGKSQETLGSIELDASGNPTSATVNQNADGTAAVPGTPTGADTTTQETASLGSEGQAYQAAYGHVLSGDYSLAEQEFQSYITTYPSSAKAADANFWLGEALYSQGKYNEAAKTFLNAHQTYGKSPKAAEMLLKLGMSLAALDNNDTACATLREVSKRYPKASRAVISKVASEQKRLSC